MQKEIVGIKGMQIKPICIDLCYNITIALLINTHDHK